MGWRSIWLLDGLNVFPTSQTRQRPFLLPGTAMDGKGVASRFLKQLGVCNWFLNIFEDTDFTRDGDA